MPTYHILFNLDKNIVQLRQIQKSLPISNKTIEDALRIFMYACDLHPSKNQKALNLLAASLSIAAKKSVESVTLKQISNVFGVSKSRIFEAQKRILLYIIPEMTSFTISSSFTISNYPLPTSINLKVTP